MGWQFAVVNGRLAEIYFDELKGNKRRLRGHCYVNKKEFKTKQEQKWIAKDIKHNRFSYRKKHYRSLLSDS